MIDSSMNSTAGYEQPSSDARNSVYLTVNPDDAADLARTDFACELWTKETQAKLAGPVRRAGEVVIISRPDEDESQESASVVTWARSLPGTDATKVLMVTIPGLGLEGGSRDIRSWLEVSGNSLGNLIDRARKAIDRVQTQEKPLPPARKPTRNSKASKKRDNLDAHDLDNPARLPDDSSSGGTSADPSSPYAVANGCLSRMFSTRDGDLFSKPMCNFSADRRRGCPRRRRRAIIEIPRRGLPGVRDDATVNRGVG